MVNRSREKLTLSATYVEKQVVVSFADDGAGIDVTRVKAKAIGYGLEIVRAELKNLAAILV